MAANTWPCADYGWWAEALTISAHTSSRYPALTGPYRPASEQSTHEAVKAFYEATLRELALGQVTPKVAATMLFSARALTKWRLADPNQAEKRRTEALDGFHRRNYAAMQGDSVPFPFRDGMRDLLNRWLPDPEKSGYSWTGRFGPGAVAEKLTHPRRFARLCDWCLLSPHWPEVPLDVLDAKHTSARLHAVPKNACKDRLITVEPCYSSYVQAWLREALQVSIHSGPLRGSAMDLLECDAPAVQRKRALQGSLTGGLATIDLSDASDSISLRNVYEVFPAWVCSLVDVTRSDTVIDPRTRPATSTMWMYAGMGNGSTFMVETLFFAAFVASYAHAHGLRARVSVFGDDIICDSEVATRLLKENFSFFKINRVKTFIGTDALRESCGIFAYKGVDITSPYVPGYPESLRGRYGLADLWWRLRTLPWSYGPRLADIISATRCLPNWKYIPDAYPCISDDSIEWSQMPPTRWNHRLQRLEVKLEVLQPVIRRFPTDWRAAKRYNAPPPQVWLCATLGGMLSSSDVVIESPTAHAPLSVSFPEKDHFRPVRRWREVRPMWAELPNLNLD